MNSMALALLLLLCAPNYSTASLGPVTNSQESSGTANPKRDDAAVTVLERVLQSMGGRSVIATLRDCTAKGTIEAGGQTPPGTFLWETSGSDFRFDNPSDSGRSVFTSNRGTPNHSNGMSSRAVPGHITLGVFPLHLPALVLWHEVADSRYRIVLMQQSEIDPELIHIRTSRDTNEATAAITIQDWFIDSRTNLPVRVEYRMADEKNATDTVSARADLLDYRIEDGILVPHTIVSYVNSRKQATAHITGFEFNRGIPAEEFDAPATGVK